jgi:hypothetical protein
LWSSNIQHIAISLQKSLGHPRRAGILYSSHNVTLDLFFCHCRRCSYLTGITFLQLCAVIHSSLNKADDSGSWAIAGKKTELEEEAISEIRVADTDSESGAEASDVEDYFKEEEEEEKQQQQKQQASAEVAITNSGQ